MPRTSEAGSLLLGTHVWIWFMLANPELAISGGNVINRAVASAASLQAGCWHSG